MTKRTLVIPVTLAAVLLCGVTLAQEPVVDINASMHPHLAAAQRAVVEANRAISESQRENKWDMHGHAEKARQLLVEVNNELKAAAETANRRK